MASGFAIKLRVTGLKRGRGWGEKGEDGFFFSHPLAFCVFNADYFCLKALTIVDVFSVLYTVEVTFYKLLLLVKCLRRICAKDREN